jgi:hypothetical protein
VGEKRPCQIRWRRKDLRLASYAMREWCCSSEWRVKTVSGIIVLFLWLALVGIVAGFIIWALSGPTLEQAIDNGIREGVKKAFINIIHSDPRFQFVKQIQMEFHRVDPSFNPLRSWDMAINVVRQHLEDEKIKFGDPAYSWDKSGAIELAHEYEIQHWESAT